MISKLKIIPFIVFIFFFGNLIAQVGQPKITEIATVENFEEHAFSTLPNTINFDLQKGTHFNDYTASYKKVAKAVLIIELYYNNLVNDNAQINFDISGESKTLEISELEPKAIYYLDFTDDFNTITNFPISITSTSNGTLLNASEIYFKVSYKIKYNLDPSRFFGSNTLNYTNVGPMNSVTQRRQVFNWVYSYGQPSKQPYIPYYQFELVRLYNTDNALVEPNMAGDIDWSNAMKINIESDLLDQNGNFSGFKLTVAEGTGLYAWRVRPVGNYYPGEFANPKNYYSSWSNTQNSFNFSDMKNPNSAGFFYLQDPDHQKNWIYSRTFSEENKVSESMGYANSLLQRKQTQTFIESQEQTFITQSIYDYQGRPTINTLPVPKNGNSSDNGLEGYESGAFQHSGQIFRDKHFDNGNATPQTMDQNTKTNYYQNNPDVAIGNANGYPYTISRFTNDGTQRVKEQSGVGLKHMIGTTNGSKTTQYSYGTASDDELLRLFGDEAPRGDKIKKTITTDPNGVSTISYTNIEGKVIATSLAYNDEDIFNGLNPDDNFDNTSFGVRRSIKNLYSR